MFKCPTIPVSKVPPLRTTIDYFGPINVKITRKTRPNQATHKRCGALFTRLNTRAVHLELASDLSTDISLIKLSKRPMKTVTNGKTYHEESLITILCKIECILNSRLLLPYSDDPSDFEALTPNNFLSKSLTIILQGYLIHHHMNINRNRNQYKEQ